MRKSFCCQKICGIVVVCVVVVAGRPSAPVVNRDIMEICARMKSPRANHPPRGDTDGGKGKN